MRTTMGTIIVTAISIASAIASAKPQDVHITAVRQGAHCRDANGDVIPSKITPPSGVDGTDDTTTGLVKLKDMVDGHDCYLFEIEARTQAVEACPAVGTDNPRRVSGTRSSGPSCQHPSQ